MTWIIIDHLFLNTMELTIKIVDHLVKNTSQSEKEVPRRIS